MTHYLLTINFVRRFALFLCLIVLIQLIEIKASPIYNHLSGDICLPQNTLNVEVIHLYLEGKFSVELGELKIACEIIEKENLTSNFSSLLSQVNQLKKLTGVNELIFQEVQQLSNQLKLDSSLLSQIHDSESLSQYVVDYAYLDRKSHYYSIKLDLMTNHVHQEFVPEYDLLSFYKVVLHFLDQFYSSGLVNAYRKVEQTQKYRLLERMLMYIVQSDSIQNHKKIINLIFAVSRKGEVGINRQLMMKSNNRSKLITRLLQQIEPLEKKFYQSVTANNFVKYYGLRNELRDTYLKLVQSQVINQDLSPKKDKLDESTTLLAFIDGEEKNFQYIYNSDDDFQLIQHEKSSIDENLTNIISEMDAALFQYSGSMSSIKRIDSLLKSMSSSLIQPIELELTPKLRIITDGQLCFLPFEMLRNENGEYLFEQYEISYQFDFGLSNSETIINKIHTVEGQFDEELQLDNFDGIGIKKSLDDFKSSVLDGSLLHLATHQVFKEDEPIILLSEVDSVTRGDWFNTPNITGVLMSMCAGFRGRLIAGENAKSFGNRAYESGAKNVISSLWAVDDFSTNILFNEYFNRLNKGEWSSKSLREAKLQYLEESDLFHQHPVFWAPFVHYGRNYKLTSKNYILPIIIIFLILFLYFSTKLKLKVTF